VPIDKPPNPVVNWALVFSLLIAVVALYLHLSATGVAFSRYNPEWNGTSSVFEMLEDRGATMVDDPSELVGKTGITLLVIAPARVPTVGEAAAYRDFVAAGNTLLLADDFGEGNALLKAVGATIRLDQRNLSSIDQAYGVPAAPIGFPVVGAPFTGDITKIIFNHPVAVNSGTPFLMISSLSWIDENGNGRADSTEPFGRFTLAATEPVGNGRVVVVGDASLFINAMQRLHDGDNELFIKHLTMGPVLVDQCISQTSAVMGPISTILWVRNISTSVILITMLALGIVAWFFSRKKR